jgi:hypothetical protein
LNLVFCSRFEDSLLSWDVGSYTFTSDQLHLNDNDSQESCEEWDSDDSDFIPQDQRTNRRRNVQGKLQLREVWYSLIYRSF